MVFFEDSKNELVHLNLIFKRGSIFAKDGVANLLAHHLKKRGTDFKKLDERAIQFGINVTKELFVVNMIFLRKYSKFVEKKLIELLKNPDFSDFEKSKQEVLVHKEALKNSNDYIAKTNLEKVIFDKPFSIPVIGENIEAISLQDLKEYLGTFKKPYIISTNKLNFEAILENFEDGEDEETPFFEVKQNNIEEFKKTEQSYIYFASPFNVYENFHLAKIATFILGSGGFGSRIMEEIRVKRGYAYSAYAYESIVSKTNKTLRGHMQTKLENTNDAIKTIKEIIKEFTENGVTEEELKSAKQFLVGSEPLKNEVLIQRLTRKFNEYYYGLGEGYYQKELELIENTSLDELNNFIREHKEINNLSFSILTNG